MVAPLEVPHELWPLTSTPEARAYLIGWVTTSVPGYREILADAVLEVAPTGATRIDNLVFSSVYLGPDESHGAFYFDDPTTLVFPDRLGWLLGFGTEAGETAQSNTSIYVPPGRIPLMGFTWTEIRSDAERQRIVDQHRRNQGYVFGQALIAQCKLTMHRWALGALLTGWCLRGKVTLGSITAFSEGWSLNGGQAAGFLTGYVLGIDSARWLDGIERTAEVVLSIAYQEE